MLGHSGCGGVARRKSAFVALHSDIASTFFEMQITVLESMVDRLEGFRKIISTKRERTRLCFKKLSTRPAIHRLKAKYT